MNTVDGNWYFTRWEDVDVKEEEEAEYHSKSSSSDDSESDDAGSNRSCNSDIPDEYDEKKEARAIGDLPIRHFRRKADLTK